MQYLGYVSRKTTFDAIIVSKIINDDFNKNVK